MIRIYIGMYNSYTSATRSSSGSSQPTLHSQWLSRKVSTGAVAASAPRTRDRMRPVQNIQSTTNYDSKYVNISFTYYMDPWICLWYIIIYHNLEGKRKKGRQKINLILLMSFPYCYLSGKNYCLKMYLNLISYI